MNKLDRLGWTAGFPFRCHGLSIGVRTNSPRLLDEIVSLLPPRSRCVRAESVDHLYSFFEGQRRPGSGVRPYHLLYFGPQRVARTLDLSEALEILRTSLRSLVAEQARGRLFLHAGVVGWKGRALLLPGASGSGKSTLVRELIRRGASYYSDEYAVLDGRGRVHPFPIPVAFCEREGAPKRAVAAESLGGKTAQGSLPVGWILFARYFAGARWRPRRLSRARTALRLLSHAPATRARPREVLPLLSSVVRQAEVWAARRGEAGEAAARLLEEICQ